MSENHCGDCKLCCKLLAIVELPEPKPRGEWCPNCDVKGSAGCKIYDNRPHECQQFICGWLSDRGSKRPLPDAFRPDRSHVIIDVTKDGLNLVIHSDPSYPGSWRKPLPQQFINAALKAGQTVFIVEGATRKRLSKSQS
jgi:hypothetical protein